MSGVAAYGVGFFLSWPHTHTDKRQTHTSAADVIHAAAQMHITTRPEQTPTHSLPPQAHATFSKNYWQPGSRRAETQAR